MECTKCGDLMVHKFSRLRNSNRVLQSNNMNQGSKYFADRRPFSWLINKSNISPQLGSFLLCINNYCDNRIVVELLPEYQDSKYPVTYPKLPTPEIEDAVVPGQSGLDNVPALVDPNEMQTQITDEEAIKFMDENQELMKRLAEHEKAEESK